MKLKRTTVSLAPAVIKAAKTYQKALGFKSLSAAIEMLIRYGLREEGLVVKEGRPQWGGHRWDGDTRPLSER